MGVFVMIIKSSAIAMQSSHLLQESTTREERLQFWVGNRNSGSGTPQQRSPLLQLVQSGKRDQVDLSAQARRLQLLAIEKPREELELTPEEDLKIKLIESMLELLSGKKIKIKVPFKKPSQDLSQSPQQVRVQNQSAGWGLQYDFQETRFEHEQLSFQAAGQVKTADGKTIDISVQLNMSRTFYSHESISIRAGDAVAPIDPLVINFDGPAAALTERNFQFDLDCDGEMNQISFVGSGSGFLCLDLNEDGRINDGSELFGPRTGNGFAELAAYDEDGNGWIDEADEIFDCLRIWTRDAQGNEVLFALGEKGIGAIYLGYADTQFSMRDSHNQENGQLRSTGIFLRENGGVGSIQQVDLLA
jgi:hypothetical protein